MDLKKKLKICASVLLAMTLVAMPLYIMTATIFGTDGNNVVQRPELPIIIPPFDAPPECVIGYPTRIQLTQNTEFILEKPIDFDSYFSDADTPVLEYQYDYPDNVLDVNISDNQILSVTSFDECGDDYILAVTATDGTRFAGYDFFVSVKSREPISTYEDTLSLCIMDSYAPYGTSDYELTSTYGAEASLAIIYSEPTVMTLTPFTDWFGDGVVALRTYDSPDSISPPWPPGQEQTSITGTEPGVSYGYFEFLFAVQAVNDPPVSDSSFNRVLTMTANSMFELTTPMHLDRMFSDVDSELSYSWMCADSLVNVEIVGSDVVKFNSGSQTGNGVISILAFDGEYAVVGEISCSVLPRINVGMVEDIAQIMDLSCYVDLATQEFRLYGSDNLIAEKVPEADENVAAVISPGENWFGSGTVCLSVNTVINDINPPHLPQIIQSILPGPIIPPNPTVNLEYDFYEFDVDVSAVNDPPYAISSPPITMAEDETRDDSFNVMDCFGDVDSALAYSIVQSPTSMIDTDINYGGGVSLAPVENWFGTQPVTVTASDGEYSVSQDVQVQVSPVNDVPYATEAGSILAMEEDATISVSLDEYISDVEDPLWYSYACNDLNSTMVLNETTWNLTIAPDENWNGLIDLVIYGSDGEYEQARELVMNVTSVNDSPEIISTANITMTEGVSLELDLSTYISDVDSELDFMIFGSRARLRCEQVQGPVWSLTPASANWHGNDMLRIFAYDGEYLVNLNLNVDVLAVNNAPTVASMVNQITMAEDSAFSMSVADLFADADDDQLSFAFESGDNLQLNYNQTTMMLSAVPVADWHGKSTIGISAFDGAIWTMTEFPVTVESVNDPPYLISEMPAIVLAAGNSTWVSLSSLFGDIDSYAITFEVLGTDNLEVTPMEARGMFNVRSTDTWEGTQTLTVRVSDGVDVTETPITVSTYVPQVTMETTVVDAGIIQSMYWMLFGVAAVVVTYAMYVTSKDQGLSRRKANKKRHVL